MIALGGHYHQAKVNHYRGVHFVQFPSSAPRSPSDLTIIRTTPDRILAIAHDYRSNRRAEGPRKPLDVPIRAGESATRWGRV